MKGKILIFSLLLLTLYSAVVAIDYRLPTLPITQLVDTWYTLEPKQIFNISENDIILLNPFRFIASEIKADLYNCWIFKYYKWYQFRYYNIIR